MEADAENKRPENIGQRKHCGTEILMDWKMMDKLPVLQKYRGIRVWKTIN